jgi:hypothetical protein
VTPLHGLVRIAQQPQGARQKPESLHRVPPDRVTKPGIVAGNGLLKVSARRRQVAQRHQGESESIVGRRKEGGVLETLGEGECLLPALTRRLVLRPCLIRDLQLIQHPEQLRRVPQRLTQHARPGQEQFSLRGALRVPQHHLEVEQHVYLLQEPLACVRERLQHV